MEFPIKLDIVKSESSILYIEGPQALIYFNKRYCIFFQSKIDLVVANSTDLDKMPHNTAFQLGLNCLPKYPSWGF